MTIDFSKLPPEQLEIASKIVAEATRQGVDPDFALAIAGAETRGSYRHANKDGVITSPKGAIGIMQIMPSTAELYRKRDKIEIDPYDVDSNIRGGVHILKDLLTNYKNPLNAAVAYNGGPKQIRKYDPKTGDYSELPGETLDYIDYINKFYPLDQRTGFIQVSDKPEKTEEAPFVPEGDKMIQEGVTVEQRNPNEIDSSKAALYGVPAGIVAGKIAQGSELPRPSSARYDRAVERLAGAQDKLAELQKRAGSLGNPADLDAEFQRARGVYAQAEAELRAATDELKALNRPPAASAASVVDEAAAASRTVPGASGASNWVRAMGQDVPDVIADTAENMRKDNPKGGQAIIDRDVAAKQKIQQLGAGDYKLSGQGKTQLMLPPELAGERSAAMEAELAQRQAREAAERQAQAQREALERSRAQARVDQAKQARQAAGEAKKTASQAQKQAQSAAGSVAKGESAVNVAQQALDRVPPPQQPGGLARAGEKLAKVAPKTLGAISGAATGYSAAEAYNEWNKWWDTYKATGKAPPMDMALLRSAEALFGGLSMLPPVTPITAAGRLIGTIGGLGLAGYEIFKPDENPAP